MAALTHPLADTTLYERDFVAWAEQMSALLLARDTAGLDWEHLAEEIADLGISQKNAVLSNLEILLLHLVKWEIQPERRSRSWERSMSLARLRIDRRFDTIPSLRRHLQENFQRCYDRAFRRAIQETHLAKDTAYTRWPLEKVMDPGFLPE